MILYAAASKKSTSDNIVYILPSGKEFIVFEKNTDSGNVEQVKKCNTLLESNQGNQIHFYSCSNSFTILPKLSLDSINKNEIASFLSWKDNNENELISANILLSEATVLFQVETYKIKEAVNSIAIEHMANLVIPYALSQNWLSGICCLTIGNKIFLAVVKNSKFEVFNTFQVSNNEEVLYYIMLYVQEFDLPQEDTVVDIFGEMLETPFLRENLSSFLRNVNSHHFKSITDARISGLAQFISLHQ